jgi:Flp pilus assembly secretin CpaC|tara:strand:+ start:6175 stop:6357 length:183 start_codon:yes stop_codon:yes gene_type:complete
MLVLEPEVNTIVAFVSKNLDFPQTRIRKTQTNVRVNDGEAISIAGLLSEEEPFYHILVLK